MSARLSRWLGGNREGRVTCPITALPASIFVLALLPALGVPAPTAADAEPAAEGSAEAVVAFEVTLPDGAAEARPPRGVVELVPLGGEGEPLAVEVRGVGPHTATASRHSMWRLRPSVPGYWGAEAAAVAGGEAAVVALHPAGQLRGALTVPRGTPRPDLLRVSFQAPPAVRVLGRPLPAGRVECPVEEGVWTCLLPAGVHDLQVQASGFATALLWEVPVAEGEVLAAPAVSLVPGAAVLGRLEVDGAALEPGDVEVELRPAGAGWRDRFRGERLGHLFHRARPDERGFFQFEGLPPGTYRVEATAAGRAPAVREPVEVMDGREAHLGPPLVLLPPSELAVFLDPPAPPGGDPWTVLLHALDGSDEDHAARADWSGAALFAGLAPGRYRLVVRAGSSHWATEEIEVAGDRSVRHLEIPLVPVEGTVRRGGEPARARIVFGGSRARPAEVSIYSDREGRFSGHLPGEGEWPVVVVLEPRGAEQRLEPVEVVREPGEEAARVELELADTLLAGRVVDAEGRAAPRATVLASRQGGRDGRSRAKLDEQGRFRFRGLPPGRWLVEAFAGGETGRAEIDLFEGDRGEVEVRLGASRRVAGHVVSPTGPVAAAAVYAIPEVDRTHPLAPVKTGPLGAFTARVPADAVGVHLLVLPPGRGARLLYVPLPEGDAPQVEVAVGELTGTLRLALPPPGSGLVTLRRGAARAPLPLLRDWARFHGAPPDEAGTWTLAGMEPGPWELCGATGCDGGSVAPGDVLELSVAGEEAREPEPVG